MSIKTLKSRQHDLADSTRQIDFLSKGIFASGGLPLFAEKIQQTQGDSLRPKTLEILQINLGYMCNQVCAHCHVDAGPCLLYTSPSPRDLSTSRMPSSA